MSSKILLSIGIIVSIICSNVITYSITDYNVNRKITRGLVELGLGHYNKLLDFELKSKEQIGIEWYVDKMRAEQLKELQKREHNISPDSEKLGGRKDIY